MCNTVIPCSQFFSLYPLSLYHMFHKYSAPLNQYSFAHLDSAVFHLFLSTLLLQNWSCVYEGGRVLITVQCRHYVCHCWHKSLWVPPGSVSFLLSSRQITWSVHTGSHDWQQTQHSEDTCLGEWSPDDTAKHQSMFIVVISHSSIQYCRHHPCHWIK